MAKITLTKPKLSSDELDRMLCSDTTDSVSMDTNSSGESVSKDTPPTELPVSKDTGIELANVSTTNTLGEMNRSATTNEP